MNDPEKKLFAPIHVLGFGVVELDSDRQYAILFQKGIGIKLIHKILNLNLDEILLKKNGIKIDIISRDTVYLHYFNNREDKIVIVIYLDKKEKILKFSDLFLISERVNNLINPETTLMDLRNICEKNIKIPKTNGVIAVFIISTAGHLFFSKYNTEKAFFKDSELQVSGFISALLIFSREIISKDTGAKLKKINFGNRHFYLNSEQNVIFAYLIEENKKNKINKRYLYLISEEFLSKYKEFIGNFDGDVSKFGDFENIINQYFII